MVVGRVRAPTITQNPPPLPRRRHGNYNEICLWDISPSTMLRIKVVCALNVNAGQMWVSDFLIYLCFSAKNIKQGFSGL